MSDAARGLEQDGGTAATGRDIAHRDARAHECDSTGRSERTDRQRTARERHGTTSGDAGGREVAAGLGHCAGGACGSSGVETCQRQHVATNQGHRPCGRDVTVHAQGIAVAEVGKGATRSTNADATIEPHDEVGTLTRSGKSSAIECEAGNGTNLVIDTQVAIAADLQRGPGIHGGAARKGIAA